MRRVIVEKKYGSASADVGTEGLLLMWGTEADDGGTNTIAIIERDDGVVVYAAPYAIRFLEPSVVAAKLAATPANIARACGMENEVEEAQEAREVSAKNPPKGFELADAGEMKAPGYLRWSRLSEGWQRGKPSFIGDDVDAHEIIANPIEVAP